MNAAMRPDKIDWRPVLSPRGRWSALVHAESSPASVARSSVGLALMAAPYLEEAQHRRAWQLSRSCRLSVMAAAELMRLRIAGVTAICPTVEIAAMCEAADLLDDAPDLLDQSGWEVWVRPMLHATTLLVVPTIPGWDRCPAIWAQVSWALSRNIPVHVYAKAA